MTDLLLYEINELQNNYKSVLKNVADKVFLSDTLAILDEINIFWQRNKNLVHCALSYLSKPYHTYVFTAASILDIDDNEHYPFLCFGDYHIWDDPIYEYINMATRSTSKDFDDELKGLIVDIINENIKILERINDKVLIFPIRMVSDIERKLVANAANQFFLSMFVEPPESVGEYLKQFNTIEDVECSLRENIKHMIIFDENENRVDNLIDRFNKFKSSAILPISLESSDAKIFWFTIIGYLSQAIDIMLTCSAYRFVPYVRYGVAFNYLLIISSNSPNLSEIDLWQFKFVISHVLHNCFDKEKYASIALDEFIKNIHKNEFEKKVFEDLQINNISIKIPDVTKTTEIITRHLKEAFSIIN